MNHSSFYFTAADGAELYTQIWEPDGEVKTAVLLLHGWGDHSNRYAHVGNAFAAAGVALTAVDMRGHGQTSGPRGFVKSYDHHLFNDTSLLLTDMKARYPNVAQVLYGHSTGGGAVLGYVIKRQPDIDGVIASSPWLKLAIEPPRLMVGAMRLLRRIYPRYTQDLGYTEGLLSRDPMLDVVSKSDSLMHSKMSAALFVEAVDNGRYVLDNAEKIPLPLLLMHGTGDKVTSYEATQQIAKRAPNATLKLWPDALHELHNEINKNQVIAYLLSWLAGWMVG